jgi:hypothetical protein
METCLTKKSLTDSAPRFCIKKNTRTKKVVDYIGKLIGQAYRFPVEVYICFCSVTFPIYQVCPHYFLVEGEKKVRIVCIVSFNPKRISFLSQKGWDEFYVNLKKAIRDCATESLVKSA